MMNATARIALAGLLSVITLPAWAEDVPAALQWVRRVELTTPVSGTITEVLVKPTDQVRKGQPLLRLDARGFQSRVEQARAALDRAKPARDEAERELERARELYDRTVLSNHELELARIAFARADAEYRAAQAGLDQAKLDLEYSAIRAPFDGIVVQRSAEAGQIVAAHLQPPVLLVLAEAGRMVVRADVNRAQLGKLTVGQTLPVTVDGKRYEGIVAGIALEPNPEAIGEPVYPVDVQFAPEQMGRYRPGQQATVTLP